MVNTRGFARLGMLAVGLGVGAAWAHPPVAAADPSSDWLSSIDGLLSGALPAADPSGLNLAISFDGMSLVYDGDRYHNKSGNTAWRSLTATAPPASAEGR